MIIFPQDGMKSDLERLWRACFGDSEEYIKFFFEHRYVPENCLVYVDQMIKRPVAMLHLLPVTISEDGGLSSAQYVYAACTRSDYRKQGIMSQLLETAIKLGQSRGIKYSVTVPAEHHLFRYYGKHGFHRCYKVRMVYMSRSDLLFLSKNCMKIEGSARETMMQLNDIYTFRRDMLIDREGYVNWDMNAFKYAVGIHEQDGGHIITVAYKGDFGYAFCSPDGDTVRITEFIAKEHFAAVLIKRILQSYPRAQKFIFRLPIYDTFFEKYGEVLDFAMIARNDGKSPVSMTTLEGIRAPYLGLPLD